MNPARRAEDISVWSRISAFRDKYSIIWTPLVFILIAAGFSFKTPSQIFDHMQKQIDSLRTITVAADGARARLETKVDLLLRLGCVNSTITRHDAALVGLECTPIIPPGSSGGRP